MKNILKPSLNWLLIFVFITIILEFFFADKHTLIFITSCLAILPLAGWLGKATEHISERTGEGIGGLLNATFGNAAELIIAFMALNKGMHEVVKASLTGSIIGNILLVLGASFVAGGIKFKTQKFNSTAAGTQSTMLMLAAVALIIPALFHYSGGDEVKIHENHMSLEISIVLFIIYGLSLLFSLHTHKHLFSKPEEIIETEEDKNHKPWSMSKSLTLLAVATGLIAWMSEIMIGSIEHAAHSFGMSSVFVGVIVVAIVGNAAEHSTAIIMAMKNKMDLSLGIAIGSSVQIALFVAPILVFTSYFSGPQPMNLVFTPVEVIVIVLSVLIMNQISSDGESNWLEGAQLIATYIIIGIVFYFLPEVSQILNNQ